MVAIVDPRKVRYPPESLIEAIDNPIVDPAGTSVAQYNCDPFDMQIEEVGLCGQNADTVFSSDGFPEVARLTNNVVPTIFNNIRARIHSKQRAEVKMFSNIPGVQLTHVWGRWNVTVRRPYVADKIRLSPTLDPMRDLTTEEQKIATDPSQVIRDNILAGTDPYFYKLDVLDPSSYRVFKNIIPFDTNIAAPAAGSTTQVGLILNPPYLEELWVLLGIWVDYPRRPASNDTFIDIQRDEDVHYMNMDVSAMMPQTVHRCWMPFTSKMVMNLTCVTAPTGPIGVGYIYGVRNLDTLDHRRWEIPYATDQETANDAALVSAHGIDELIKGGMLP
jgi:hypothetical protein